LSLKKDGRPKTEDRSFVAASFLITYSLFVVLLLKKTEERRETEDRRPKTGDRRPKTGVLTLLHFLFLILLFVIFQNLKSLII